MQNDSFGAASQNTVDFRLCFILLLFPLRKISHFCKRIWMYCSSNRVKANMAIKFSPKKYKESLDKTHGGKWLECSIAD